MIGKKINQLATELAPVSTDLTIIGDPISGVSKKITLAQLGAIFSGAVSFYTNLAGFPATGDINVIYCAKDTQKLYLWSGSAYTEVFPSQALLDTYQLRSEKGVSNGYASLDSTGKVPISQLPSSIMEYKGTWNAATNTPTLANGTGDTGDVYICNVAGTVNFGAGPITFAVGDYVIYSGTIWQRSSGAVGTVTSVAASITGNAIGITGSPVTTSGTLAFAFAGTGAQYIKGDGTLATFPSTIAQAERLITEVYNSTGATLTKGTIVYINGGQGNLPTVTKALATGDSTSAQTFGVVQADITNMNNGYVVVAGKLSDLDTQAYTPGTQLYLSSTTAGTWTSTKQYAPNHLVYVGIVVRSHPTQGIVEVKIQNGYELDELHNVAAQTPTNNDGLFWESSTSLWKNKSIATILGYTPQAQLNGTGFVKASGTTITYDNSTYLTTSAAATTYLPMVLSSTANVVDINGQQFNIWGSAGGFTSGRIIVDPVFSAIGYQNAGVFDGLKILTNGNAEFSNSGITRFFNQVRFDSTLTNGTYTYTLPGATGTLALVSQLTGGTVTSVGLSSATSGVTIGSTPITTSGTITLAIATASGSQQGLLSSTDWTTFNNKQNALTNPVTGTGTTNYLPKFTGTSTIGNSIVSESGSTINIAGNIVVSGGNNLRVLTTTNATTGFQYADFLNTSGRLVWGINGSAANGLATNSLAYGGVIYADNTLQLGVNGDMKMTLNASGNLGLGVTPSAWSSPFSVFQLGTFNQYIAGQTNAADMKLGTNHYYGSGDYRYGNSTDRAARYDIGKDGFSWNIAPSGTAGNAISFTQAMTLDTGGRLLIGTTTSSASTAVRLVINSSLGGFAGFAFNNNGGGAIGSPTSSTLAFYTATGGIGAESYSEAMRISSSGNLSIGNTNDTYKLDVSGTGRFQASASSYAGGSLILTSSAGTNPIYLTSNGGYFALSNGGGADHFLLASTGAATFSSSVTINGNDLFLNSTAGDITNMFTSPSSHGFYIDFPSSYFMAIRGSSEFMRINSSGNVGIGTTSPSGKLHIAATTGTASPGSIALAIRDSGNSGYGFDFNLEGVATGDLSLMRTEAGSQAQVMTFKRSNGNVGIGTTSPLTTFTVKSTNDNGYALTRPSDASSYHWRLSTTETGGDAYTTRYNTFNNEMLFTTYASGGTGGNIIWRTGASGVGSETERMRITSGGNVGIGTTSPNGKLNISNGGAEGIEFWVISATATNLMQSYNRATSAWNSLEYKALDHIFYGSGSERMRITSGGQVLIGQTAANGGANGIYFRPGIESGFIVTNDIAIQLGRLGSTGDIQSFYSGTTRVGTISVSGSNTSYNTSSDYRLKEDLKDYNGLDLIDKIKTYDFAWKKDKSRNYGVIAHEIASIIPYVVMGEKDGEFYQGVDYSKIVPVLIKAIQELNDKIK